MMRTTQEIFNAVIDRGLYGQFTTRFMCNALDEAFRLDVITNDEHYAASKEIKEYLDDWFTFGAALKAAGLPASFPNRLAIYRNWANRPQLRMFSGI